MITTTEIDSWDGAGKHDENRPLSVGNSPNWPEYVRLELGGLVFMVNGADLLRALENARNASQITWKQALGVDKAKSNL